MPHKFILGQAVAYTSPTGTYAPPGIYVVTSTYLSATVNLNITSSIPANCTNALQRKANFARAPMMLGNVSSA
jgi:hypothetical protein